MHVVITKVLNRHENRLLIFQCYKNKTLKTIAQSKVRNVRTYGEKKYIFKKYTLKLSMFC